MINRYAILRVILIKSRLSSRETALCRVVFFEKFGFEKYWIDVSSFFKQNYSNKWIKSVRSVEAI